MARSTRWTMMGMAMTATMTAVTVVVIPSTTMGFAATRTGPWAPTSQIPTDLHLAMVLQDRVASIGDSEIVLSPDKQACCTLLDDVQIGCLRSWCSFFFLSGEGCASLFPR